MSVSRPGTALGDLHVIGLAAAMGEQIRADPVLGVAGLRLTVWDTAPVARDAGYWRELEAQFTQNPAAPEAGCGWCGQTDPAEIDQPLVEDFGDPTWECRDAGACFSRRAERFPPLPTPGWIQSGIDAAEAAKMTLDACELAARRFLGDAGAEMALIRFASGEDGRREDELRLTWVERLAREIAANPEQAERDIADLPTDWQTAAGVARARWLAAHQQPVGSAQPPAPAVHPTLANGQGVQHATIANGKAAQHQMLSRPGVRAALGVHGTVRHGLSLQGRTPRPLGSAKASPPAAQQPPVPPPRAPRHARPARRPGHGPRYGR